MADSRNPENWKTAVIIFLELQNETLLKFDNKTACINIETTFYPLC